MPGVERGSTRGAAGTRGGRRRASRARRNRIVLAVAVVASVAIVAAWFPVSDLLHQRQQLGTATAALSRLDHENHALRREAKQLHSPADIARIAQQQYGLVSPGEVAYQVLPSSGSGSAGGALDTRATALAGTGTGTGSRTGTGTGTGTGGVSDARGSPEASGASGSFVTRVLQTLEFWR